RSDARAFQSVSGLELFPRLDPVGHIPADLVLGKAVTLLELAFELLAATLDHVEIVVGELAPLLLGGALELLPVAFNPVPIHRHPSVWVEMTINERPQRTFLSKLRHHAVDQPAALASRRRAVRMYSV